MVEREVRIKWESGEAVPKWERKLGWVEMVLDGVWGLGGNGGRRPCAQVSVQRAGRDIAGDIAECSPIFREWKLVNARYPHVPSHAFPRSAGRCWSPYRWFRLNRNQVKSLALKPPLYSFRCGRVPLFACRSNTT